MDLASRTAKRVQLELGGKNPFIVLDDADVDAAAENAASSLVLNTGQICATPGRYYVHAKIYNDFVDKMIANLKKVVVGDPADEKTEMGPLVSAEHRDKVEGYFKAGVNEDAKLLLGGQRPKAPPLDKGYFVMPTVFTHVNQKSRLAREEVFGPIGCIMEPFNSDEEVLALANDNTFGLCASVWTKDTARGIRMVNEIRAGTGWVNKHMEFDLPWGGYRESGFGKDNSIMGNEEYTQIKSAYVKLD
jgi:betaine-aldehyde dehydrogenase